MQDKIDDLECAIDDLDTAIATLNRYEQYNKEVADLKMYKSALEYDLDQLKQKREELSVINKKEAQKENIEQERQYWREAI